MTAPSFQTPHTPTAQQPQQLPELPQPPKPQTIGLKTPRMENPSWSSQDQFSKSTHGSPHAA